MPDPASALAADQSAYVCYATKQKDSPQRQRGGTASSKRQGTRDIRWSTIQLIICTFNHVQTDPEHHKKQNFHKLKPGVR
eukprot:1159529-Pelagomonas_calceolata.AAC.1